MPRGGQTTSKPGPAKGSKPRLVTPSERVRVRELHGQGLSRNAIAKALGRPWSTVTKIAREEGLSFDRTATAKAVEAARVDHSARRASIINRLYGRTEAVLDRLEADSYTYRVPTAEGSFVVNDKAPPAQDERNLSSAISGYLANAAKLEQLDVDPSNLPGVDAWLRAIAGLGD